MNSGISSPSPSTHHHRDLLRVLNQSLRKEHVAQPARSLRFDGYKHCPEWGGTWSDVGYRFPSCKCSKYNVHLCSNPQKQKLCSKTMSESILKESTLFNFEVLKKAWKLSMFYLLNLLKQNWFVRIRSKIHNNALLSFELIIKQLLLYQESCILN